VVLLVIVAVASKTARKAVGSHKRVI
jgi:hypothetical protein